MAPVKMAQVNNLVNKIQKPQAPGSRFADILAQKKTQDIKALDKPWAIPQNLNTSGLNKIFTSVLSNHEASAKAMSSSLVRKDYTPEKLLKSQFSISMFLLREQMYTKTAELSANTLKNFTQMQV